MYGGDDRRKAVTSIEEGDIQLGRLSVTPLRMIGLVLGALVCTCIVSAGFGLNNTLGGANDKPITRLATIPRVSALVPQPNNNTSFCSFIRQYKLHSGSKRATVCVYQNRVRLDIRQFILDKPTIKGIVLNYDEYRSLDAQWSSIFTCIKRISNITGQV